MGKMSMLWTTCIWDIPYFYQQLERTKGRLLQECDAGKIDADAAAKLKNSCMFMQ